MILLDTCTLLWLGLSPEELSAQARTVLESPTERFYVSAISGFEIGQKHALGKLELKLPPELWVPQALESHRLEELPLTLAIALRAATLPRLHSDPFDRLLIATALEHRLTLLTPDPKIQASPGSKRSGDRPSRRHSLLDVGPWYYGVFFGLRPNPALASYQRITIR